MSLANYAIENSNPYVNETSFEIKTLSEISELLTTSTKRNASVNHEPETVDKATLTLISSILLNSGFDAGRTLLKAIMSIIIAVLKTLLEFPDIRESIHKLINAFEVNPKKCPLSVHRTTVDNMLPNFTKKETDEMLVKNYQSNMKELETINAKSKEITLCIDETPETIHSKYQNGNFQYIHVGQKSTWEKGFEYSSLYDATHQLHMGILHEDKFLTSSEKKQLRPWLNETIKKIEIAEQIGSHVKNIDADRGYFSAEPFALAYLGFLDHIHSERDLPRFIIPRKFWKQKDNFKWDYILDDSQPQVFLDHIHLNPYTHPALKNLCKDVFEQTKDYRYKIPYACVALVDEYNNKSNRSFEELRELARSVEKGINNSKNKLKQAEKTYITYLYSLQTGKKKKISKPNYTKGRKRTKFKDSTDKANYLHCFSTYNQLNEMKKKKTQILNSFMFMAISLRPGEDPTKNPDRFIARAKDYHERWGIERGFEDVKGKFIRDARSRKPTRRQLNLMIGMCLDNNWHVARMQLMLEEYRKSAWNKVPWDPDRPWIRRRIEQDFGDRLSAHTYLIQVLSSGIKMVIQKKIKEFI